MAKLSKRDVLKLAQLSKIKLSDEEADKLVRELSEIIKYIEQIESVNTEGLEPTSQVTGLKNVMRPDEVIDYGETTEGLLKNAPGVENNQIRVARVL